MTSAACACVVARRARRDPECDVASVVEGRCASRSARPRPRVGGQRSQPHRLTRRMRPRRASATIARASRLISVGCLRRLGGVRTGRRRRASRSARVGQPVEQLGARLRLGRVERQQALRQRDERPGEVAAVHRRDVARVQRRQRGRVVPVQEMPAISFEAFERRQRAVETLDERVGREIAEVVRGQRRQQTHPDVGRRGPARQLAVVGVLLVVVGRQPAHRPRSRRSRSSATSCARSGAAACVAVGERAHAGADRHAEPVGHHRRDGPQQRETAPPPASARCRPRNDQRRRRPPR